tara:strand:+ start:1149 stop:3956 length:2808 start_codon:yes stop_codon:yes gene_type:complete
MSCRLFIYFLIVPFIGFSQGKYDNLIESAKYSKAEKKINKKLSKDPNSYDCIYSKCLLLNKRDYKGYSTNEAYTTIQNMDKGIRQLPASDKEKYAKGGLTFQSVKALKNDILNNAFEDVMKLNEIEDYKQFQVFYTSTDQGKKSQIQNKIYTLAFQAAKKKVTSKALNDFLDEYPSAPQRKTAITLRNNLAFSEAKEENTVEAFMVFIHSYPKSSLIKQAWQHIYKMEFESVSSSSNYRDYLEYIREYPNSPYNSVAQDKYELYLYKEKTKSGFLDDYISFIQEYPSNKYKSEAIHNAFQVGSQSTDFLKLQYVAEKLSNYGEISEIVEAMYKIIQADGRSSYLEKFYGEYTEYIIDFDYNKDIALAYRYDNLSLKNVTFENYTTINDFIRDAAPRAIALKALIAMCRNPIDALNWNETTKIFKKYRSDFTTNKAYEKTLLLLEQHVIDDFKKISFGPKVNSEEGQEYTPIITADGNVLYFCGRNRNDNIGGEDIFVSYKNGFEWQTPILMNRLSSSNKNEAPESITIDGTQMTLFISGDLYETEKTIEGWSVPEIMGEYINQGNWNADVSYTGDQQAVLFTSKREGGYNYVIEEDKDRKYPTDIYVSTKDDYGNWQQPINLGSTINTMFTERSPFLHPDMKTLYFSSNGHGGLGDLDVYMCTRLKEDSWTDWSTPVNLGKYFNTSGNNWGYKISTDGKKAYFSEQKSIKDQNQDLFWTKLPPRLRPELVATIKGNLKNRNSKPIGAHLVIEDLTSGKFVAEANSDPMSGDFFVVLPLGKIYGYHVEKNEFYPMSGNIDLRLEEDAVEKLDNIEMITFEEMINEKLAVPVNNLFFDFGKSDLLPTSKPELNRIAEILKKGELKIRIEGHTDNVGNDDSNYKLSHKRCNGVKHYLISQGVSPSQMETIGFGSKKAVATNETEEGRALNRRVELRFI